MKTEKFKEIPKHAFIWLLLLFAFYPMYVMLNISFKTNVEFMENPWLPSFPMHFENWVIAWNVVGHYIFNTIFVAVSAVGLTFCFALPASFFFARYKVPGSSFLWYAFLILMLMPSVANLVPLFMLLKNLNLLNSLFALILVGVSAMQIMQIFVLRNFIEEIPSDLFEAAEMDGAGPIKQIIHVVIPLSGSIISTLAILNFITQWNDYILPMIVIRDDSLLTLASGLVKLDGEYVKRWGEMMAGYTIASIPLVLLFIFTLRAFVKGLASGGIKG